MSTSASHPPPETPKRKDKSKEKSEQQEVSDEDKKLQEELEMLVERLREQNTDLYFPTLDTIRQLIRSSTTSITSVPKPLKYMVPHYQTMKDVYNKLKDKECREACADIISVLAMTMGQDKDCVTYRLLANPLDSVCNWGHEYVRHLSSEISSSWPNANKTYKEKLFGLVKQIVPYTLAHNAEAEACDLLMEIDQLDLLEEFIDDGSYPRISLYLHSCVPYVPEPENTTLLKFVLQLAKKFKRPVEAMRFALILNDCKEVRSIFDQSPDEFTTKQLALLLGRHRSCLDFSESDEPPSEEIMDLMTNAHLNNFFISLARDLDILEPKSPEDVYKTHLDTPRPSLPTQVDSARNNLAASFVNGFLNSAFGTDEMFRDLGNRWIYKNKDHGMLSATASLGLIKLWDVDGGLAAIDKYLYSSDDFIKAGALYACGILNTGIRSDVEPAHAILSDYLANESKLIQKCAILGIGVAYAGTNSSLALTSLRQVMQKTSNDFEVQGVLSISIGMIAVSTGNSEDTELLFQHALICSESKEQSPYIRFIFLAIGLIYLGRQGECETLIETIRILKEPFRTYATTIVEMCAYAGTGNVLKVQRLLHVCCEHCENKKKSEGLEKGDQKDEGYKKIDFTETQVVAVIGVALISMGEDIGTEMAFRTFGHVMQYGEPSIRRTVPLAIAMSCISNPKQNVLDMLNKFSHDNDPEVTHSAIFAMGFVGAGTNNARLALLLRQLAQFYAKDANNLFLVRIAQGLTHLGKGTMTLSPYHSDRQIMRPSSVAALVNVLFAGLDFKNLILGPAHYLLYLLTPAIEPRCLITVDEKLNHLQVPVRVGIAVDIVAQAGKPKTITGFQTNTTPVLLATGERAELATDAYISSSPILEGFVILTKKSDEA